MQMEVRKCPLFGLASRETSLLPGTWVYGRRSRMSRRTRVWHFLYWAPAKILWASRNISSCMEMPGSPRAVQRRYCTAWPKFTSDQMLSFLQNQSAANRATSRGLNPGDLEELARGIQHNDESTKANAQISNGDNAMTMEALAIPQRCAVL